MFALAFDFVPTFDLPEKTTGLEELQELLHKVFIN